MWEELVAGDVPGAREVYKSCVRVVPHRAFSFSKVWLLWAQLEVRQLDINAARAVLGRALGVSPKPRLFKSYIDLELQLGNVDRCRTLYQRFVESFPAHCPAWIAFSALERQLGEAARARALYELAIQQPHLDTPELVWKAYIGTVNCL